MIGSTIKKMTVLKLSHCRKLLSKSSHCFSVRFKVEGIKH
jgi:hypothetical protein